MTVDRQGDGYVFHCDHCPEYVETGEEEFSEAVERLRAEGWLAYRDCDGWCHMCPACREEARRD